MLTLGHVSYPRATLAPDSSYWPIMPEQAMLRYELQQCGIICSKALWRTYARLLYCNKLSNLVLLADFNPITHLTQAE